MRPWVLCACVVGLLATQRVQRPLTTSAIANEWLDAAEAHEPGKNDAALQKIASWNADHLERALRGIRRAKASDALNELLERGALLHGDIALLNPELSVPTRIDGWTSPVGARLARDGRALGESGIDAHVYYARAFLWSMRPPPVVTLNEHASAGLKRTREWEAARATNPRLRQWFRALSAHFAARHWFSDQLAHLDDAARMVVGDTAITFDAGCYGEAIASPKIQRSLERAPPPVPQNPEQLRNSTASLLNDRFNLADAERHYRTVLAREPGHAEARVRLARVLIRSGRHADAIALLRPRLETSDGVIRYYGALVRAQAAEATASLDAAREAYEHAAALFPLAQSPLLALIRLARERADEQAVKDLTLKMTALGHHERQRPDPWWNYFDCNGRNRNTEVERLWAMYRTTQTR